METLTSRSQAYERFAALCAFGAAVTGVAYSAAFVAVVKDVGGRSMVGLSSFFLLVGGLLAVGAALGLYSRLREIDPGFALLALVLGLAGGIGASIHGAFDLAKFVEPPQIENGLGGLPNSIDPRGFLTFGVSGLALFVAGFLIRRDSGFARGLSYVAILEAVLLVIVYLGRLIILNPDTPLLRTAALVSGFLVNPAFYVWLGLELQSGAALDSSR
jgi:hypothetical protein